MPGIDVRAGLTAALSDRYRVERELGSGGMAIVYAAHDVRHDRQVAVKVLRPELAAVIGADRFLHEIRTTANLQHPHILALFDSGQVDGTVFYVMPFVEGESLRDRLTREKQLPIDEAVRIAKEVASALDYAHRKGVIHRDIKPENILLQDGQARVADFGIALAAGSVSGTRMTETGLSLGTPTYMSPEQAMGERTLDARSDVYALGCVLYEMLIGEPPFTGPTAQAVAAKVLTAEPVRLTELRKTVPAGVEAAVLHALEKLPADRFASAADFARALGDPAFRRTTGVQTATVAHSARSRWRDATPWSIAGLAVTAAVAAIVFSRPTANPAAIRGPIFATIDLRGVGVPSHGNDRFSVSADGHQLALAVERDGNAGIGVRSLDSPEIRYLADTRGAHQLFWSPDGKAIGFFTDDSLKTIEVASGVVRSLCSVLAGSGGSWSPTGTILFSTQLSGLHRTSSSGGDCGALPINSPPEAKDLRPYFLPDGRHFVASTDIQVWLGAIDDDWLVKLIDYGGRRGHAVFAPPHFLLFKSSSDALQSQRIDLTRWQLVGDPITILPFVGSPGAHTSVAATSTGVLVAGPLRSATGAVPVRSATGAVTVQAGGRLDDTERISGALVFERSTGEDKPFFSGGGAWAGRRVSRDGKHVALGGWTLRRVDLATGESVRVGGSVESLRYVSAWPVWSPGDAALAYVRQPEAAMKVERADLRSGDSRTLFAAPEDTLEIRLTDWSHDAHMIAFERVPASGAATREPWEYDLRTSKMSRMFDAAGDESEMQYAPGGGWIAYQSTVSGESNVLLRPHPGSGPPTLVSPAGGSFPRWRTDGSELFYIGRDGAVMMVPIQLSSSPPNGTAKVGLGASAVGDRRVRWFGVSPDGQRFYLELRSEVPALTLVLNWWALLEPRPPASR